MTAHYTACVVAYDTDWIARARRAGGLDGFHGYPMQSAKGKPPALWTRVAKWRLAHG